MNFHDRSTVNNERIFLQDRPRKRHHSSNDYSYYGPCERDSQRHEIVASNILPQNVPNHPSSNNSKTNAEDSSVARMPQSKTNNSWILRIKPKSINKNKNNPENKDSSKTPQLRGWGQSNSRLEKNPPDCKNSWATWAPENAKDSFDKKKNVADSSVTVNNPDTEVVEENNVESTDIASTQDMEPAVDVLLQEQGKVIASTEQETEFVPEISGPSQQSDVELILSTYRETRHWYNEVKTTLHSFSNLALEKLVHPACQDSKLFVYPKKDFSSL